MDIKIENISIIAQEMKYLGVNLAGRMHDLYAETYTMLIKIQRSK